MFLLDNEKNNKFEEVIPKYQHEVQHAKKNANKSREEAEEAKLMSNKVKLDGVGPVDNRPSTD